VQAHQHKQQEGKKKKGGGSKCDANAKTKKIVALLDVVIVAAVVSPLATQSLPSSAFHQREKGSDVVCGASGSDLNQSQR